MTDERFELIERLGSGGMASVWRARDRRLDREIALKRPLPHLAADAEAVARFEREARAAAALNHPNVVTVYDAGEDDEGPWLAMELVHGVSLRHVLDRRGPLPVEQVDDYVRQAAAGLDAAHERGLVHRDIKPQNLMVGDDGRVRLTDFGLARPVTQETPITAEGTVLGSVRYLAPEALESRQGASGDIYSLAAVAYEMLTGRPPFDAPSTAELLERIRADTPIPMSQLRPEVARYDAVFAAALSKNPADRPPMASAFAAELGGIAGATVPMPVAAAAVAAPSAPDATLLMRRAPAPSPRRRLPLAMAATLAVVAAALLVLVGVALTDGTGRSPEAEAADTTSAPTATTPPSTTTTAAPTTTTTSSTTTTTTTTTTVPPVEAVIGTLAAELSDALDAAAPRHLKPKEAREITKAVGEAVAAYLADDLDEAEKKLSDAAEKIDKDVESAAIRLYMLGLLDEMATAMGIDPPA